MIKKVFYALVIMFVMVLGSVLTSVYMEEKYNPVIEPEDFVVGENVDLAFSCRLLSGEDIQVVANKEKEVLLLTIGSDGNNFSMGGSFDSITYEFFDGSTSISNGLTFTHPTNNSQVKVIKEVDYAGQVNGMVRVTTADGRQLAECVSGTVQGNLGNQAPYSSFKR